MVRAEQLNADPGPGDGGASRVDIQALNGACHGRATPRWMSSFR